MRLILATLILALGLGAPALADGLDQQVSFNEVGPAEIEFEPTMWKFEFSEAERGGYVVVHADGTVEFGGGADPSETMRRFAEHLRAQMKCPATHVEK